MTTTPHPFPITPFTYHQAHAGGLSRRQLRDGLADGRVIRLLHEVYVDRSVEATPELRAQAALLVTSPHHIVCDRLASWIHGVDCWRYRELDVPAPVEVCVLRGHEPSERPELRCLTRDLAPHDVVTIGGLRVTTPIRTALDLGCRLWRRDAFVVMNALAREHRFDHTDLLLALPRYRRRRGVVQLRQLAPLVVPKVESQRESWVYLEIHDQGLPLPQPQWELMVGDVLLYRLDFAYPHAKVVVEYDGEANHTSDEDKLADEKRRTWLRAHGWVVIVVTKADFAVEGTPPFIHELRAALRLAA